MSDSPNSKHNSSNSLVVNLSNQLASIARFEFLVDALSAQSFEELGLVHGDGRHSDIGSPEVGLVL